MDNRMRQQFKKCALSAIALIFLTAEAYAAPAITEITLPGTRVFPESITSTADGTLIIGSLGHANVMRIAPGKSMAEEWITPGSGGLNQVLGVFADEKGKTLWVCSNNLENKGEATAVMAFDLRVVLLRARIHCRATASSATTSRLPRMVQLT
jgi:hypothetical protein